MRRSVVLLVMAALTLLLGACRPYQFHGTAYEPPLPAPAVNGQNLDGQDFSLTQLKGKAVLVFFGYTNCPDVCPTTLAEMRLLRQNLGQRAEQTAFVYITIDPERDTLDRLRQYIPLFDPHFYGVRVHDADLETVKKGYGVYSEKVYTDPQNPAAGYSVDHTARVYLIGPDGLLVATYPYQTDIAGLQQDVEHLIKS